MTFSSPRRTPPRKFILFVDDDEGMRTAMYNMFSREYRVSLAVDGVDGYLKANIQPRPDLIIVDVAMPQLDGITMVRRIRENQALRQVPIIFLTGRMSPASLIEGMAVSPFAYLPKSGDPQVLENKVKDALALALPL
ncbi:MAG TPA: response regulator [Polyangiaceae bacterium]|jgi:CheY-like chemotaxis protein|nr:response regulator [Polyangiaceae bacterium]